MYLNKILPVLFSPIVLVLLAIFLAIITRRRVFAVAGALLLWLAATPLVADRALRLVQGDMVRLTPTDVVPADAIVVLAGSLGYTPGRHGPAADWGGSVDRVLAGIELAQAGRAPWLVFSSGINAPTGQATEGERAREWAIAFGVEPARILLSSPAANTAEEARMISPLLAGVSRKDVSPKVLLVTSAYHMPRAAMIFSEAGCAVTAYPVDINLPVRRRWFDDWLPEPYALVRTDTALRELIGQAYYWLGFRARRLGLTDSAPTPAEP